MQDTKSALESILQQLSVEQIRFVIARLDTDTDKDACTRAGLNYGSFRNTPKEKRELINQAIALMAYDGLVTALHLRRRALAKAMAIKLAGLDSRDERVRQNVATEIIEWELGKAMQRQEHTGAEGRPIEIIEVICTQPIDQN
ncbi:MAG: hypothetical protein QM296_03925 [Bacillota bacterium]|nr:hypothetical protein [Bacillota bacterium]